jgi:hypothetical protein
MEGRVRNHPAGATGACRQGLSTPNAHGEADKNFLKNFVGRWRDRRPGHLSNSRARLEGSTNVGQLYGAMLELYPRSLETRLALDAER